MEIGTRNTKMDDELNLLNAIAINHFHTKGLYDYQKDLYHRIEDNPLNIICKSRKIGISFFYGGFAALKSMCGEKVGIISQSQPQAWRVGQFMSDWLDGFRTVFPDLDSHIKEFNKSHLLWDNRGEVVVMPNSAVSSVGYEFDKLFLDEWARFLHGTDKRIWGALFPSLSRSKKMSVIANSTPYGEGNIFHQQYTDRKAYPDFKPVFYHWSECPDINIDIIRRNLDSLTFQQDYEGLFIGDMTSFYPLSLVKNNENADINYLTLASLRDCPWPCYGFMDVGRRSDFTAIIVVADTGQKLRVVYKKVLKTPDEKKWDNQYAEVRTLLDTGKLNRFYIDRGGLGMELAERISEEYNQAQGFDFDNENKSIMHTSFKKRLENNGLELVADMELFSSLHMIERKQSGNTVVYGSDKRTDELGHADLAVALIGAVYVYDLESGASVNPCVLNENLDRFGNPIPRVNKRSYY